MIADLMEPRQLALYVLAHQDDEYGCIAQLRRDVASGRRVVVLFLTDGTMPKVGGDVRTAESRAVLERIGVAPGDIVVVGAPLGIPCLALPQRLDDAYRAMLGWLRAHGCARPVHVTTCAWEGGNPDHDAAHLAAARLARELGAGEFREFALYNGYRRSGPFFRVLSFCDGARVGGDAGPRLTFAPSAARRVAVPVLSVAAHDVDRPVPRRAGAAARAPPPCAAHDRGAPRRAAPARRRSVLRTPLGAALRALLRARGAVLCGR